MGRRIKHKRQFDDDKVARFEKMRRSRKEVKGSDLLLPFQLERSRWKEVDEEGKFTARVVEVHKRYAFISPEPKAGQIQTRDVWLATVAKRHLTTVRAERNFICVGDIVLCRPSEEGELSSSSELPQCVILHQAPRGSEISRLDPMTPDRRHVLAANMDQLVIVASYLMPTVKWGLIDRYLVLAESQGLPASIILNKEDLLLASEDEAFRKDCEDKRNYLSGLGYQVFSVAADSEDDDEDAYEERFVGIENLFATRISLLSGHSGVGKSSIVNRFDPEISQDVEPNADIFYKGRHTTSYASFIRLGTGGYLIDTPGIRSFCIEEKDSLDLSYCFRDLRPYFGQCQYRRCRHIEEPGCVVRQAVEEGIVPEWRYKSYLAILLGAAGREGRLRDITL